jgi:hypothetical protein
VLKSELSIDISTTSSKKVMRIFDTSKYCENEEIANYLIEVLPVNKSTWVTFFVSKGFSLALNSSNLQYSKATTAADLVDLPDGVYEIKQSFKPNIYTLQHYMHLRIATLVEKIKDQRDKLLGDKCSISREDFIKNRDALREIEEYAEAAKYRVEEKRDKKQGIELYQWAEKLLEQYTNECQC